MSLLHSNCWQTSHDWPSRTSSRPCYAASVFTCLRPSNPINLSHRYCWRCWSSLVAILLFLQTPHWARLSTATSATVQTHRSEVGLTLDLFRRHLQIICVSDLAPGTAMPADDSPGWWSITACSSHRPLFMSRSGKGPPGPGQLSNQRHGCAGKKEMSIA